MQLGNRLPRRPPPVSKPAAAPVVAPTPPVAPPVIQRPKLPQVPRRPAVVPTPRRLTDLPEVKLDEHEPQLDPIPEWLRWMPEDMARKTMARQKLNAERAEEPYVPTPPRKFLPAYQQYRPDDRPRIPVAPSSPRISGLMATIVPSAEEIERDTEEKSHRRWLNGDKDRYTAMENERTRMAAWIESVQIRTNMRQLEFLADLDSDLDEDDRGYLEEQQAGMVEHLQSFVRKRLDSLAPGEEHLRAELEGVLQGRLPWQRKAHEQAQQTVPDDLDDSRGFRWVED